MKIFMNKRKNYCIICKINLIRNIITEVKEKRKNKRRDEKKEERERGKIY